MTFNTGGPSRPFPSSPAWCREDVALVLTQRELHVIEEAELILGLLYENRDNIRGQQEALDLYYGEDPALYDPARDIAETLSGLRDKIDHALRRHKLAIREWRIEAEKWLEENRNNNDKPA